MERKVFAAHAKMAAKAARTRLFGTPEYKRRGREAALLRHWYKTAKWLLAERAALAAAA